MTHTFRSQTQSAMKFEPCHSDHIGLVYRRILDPESAGIHKITKTTTNKAQHPYSHNPNMTTQIPLKFSTSQVSYGIFIVHENGIGTAKDT